MGMDTLTADAPALEPLAVAPTSASDSLLDIEGSWWLCRCKYHEESRLASDLESLGIPHYYPQVKRNRYRFGKKETVWTPLFPGYLAFVGDDSTRYDAIQTHHTMQIIPVIQRDRFVRELESIRIAVTANPKLGEFRGIIKGKPCRVTAGPFMGTEGLVDSFIKEAKEIRIGVKCRMMGRALVVNVGADMIEILSQDAD
jgi:transcription antitermination factor NusG